MLKKYKDKMYCFSPPVMLATFFIEFALAFYTIWRYKMTTISRLAVAILFALGTFQLAEYMLCGGLGLTNVEWARLGYVSITLLPAFGIHMITALANKKMPVLINAAYATSAAFIVLYLFAENAVAIKTCYANYAVFSSFRGLSIPFGIYYYGWLFVGTFLAWKWSKETPERSTALKFMSIGYLSFILPTTTFNIIDPSTVSGIPSIMCGFAILLALTLATKVIPNSCKIDESSNEGVGKFRLRI